MKIGIIGPNKVFEGSLEERKRLIDSFAEIIANSGSEVVLTPDKDSLLEYFGKRYLEFGGKKIWLVVPVDEKDYEEYLNVNIGEVVSCSKWDVQPAEFNRESDVFVCVGYSWGGMREIGCAQYFNKKKIYVLNEFISGKLPDELNFLVEYIGLGGLGGVLNGK